MDNIESTSVPLTVSNNTSTSHVTSTSDHNNIASIEFYKVDNLILFKIELDGVIDTDMGVGVADGSAVMSDDVGYTFSTKSDLSDFQELV